MVDDKREIHDHSGGVALAVGAGVGFVGWHAVVGGECIIYVVGIGSAENDDATACTFHFGSDVFPTANGMQILILHLVWVNRDGIRQKRPVGILGDFIAAIQQSQDAY